MNAILSDCSIVARNYHWWCNLNGNEWDQILADAEEIGYSFRDTLRSIKRLAVAREFNHVKFYELVKEVQKQHLRAYRWFKSKHGADSRLAYIPADLLGMIDEYLRAVIVTDNATTTHLMGSAHSFSGRPSMRYPTMMAWHKFGKLHREAGPSTMFIWPVSKVTFMWSRNDNNVPIPSSGQVSAVEYGPGTETTYYVKYAHTSSALGEATTNPVHIAKIREICRRDLGIELP